jgi:PEP-CTERM motif-containing protein
MNRAAFRNLLAIWAALGVSSQALAGEIELVLGPGGTASLMNSSLDSPIVLMSYSIARSESGVGLSPTGWNSFQRQGNLFLEASATVDLLSEGAVTDGLLFSAGQSRSIGLPFNLRSDADGNGRIDLTDFAIWKDHQGQSLQGPSFGDFDNSGVVDLDDFDILLTQMGTSAVFTFAATTTAVPEPSTVLFALVGTVGLGLAMCRLVVRRASCRNWRPAGSN